MDAGIPLLKPAAGIAIGLASEEDEKGFKRYKLITDIQDLEDGPGGMDFKVVGTEQGITAVQMDTKTKGLTMPMVVQTLEAAFKARLEVLEKMKQVLASPRPELSPYAPQVVIFKINPDKIRDVIGPGGRVINDIIDHTGAMIDIEQDGSVAVTSANKESLQKAVDWIKNLTREIAVGEVFDGKVTRIMDFGAFVELVPGQEGMVHVSEMDYRRVEHPGDMVKIDDVVKVKVMEIDKQGRINLSMKVLKTPPEGFSGRHEYVPRGEKRPARRPFRRPVRN